MMGLAGGVSRQNQDLRDYKDLSRRPSLFSSCRDFRLRYGEKRKRARIEILKISTILRILILTKTRESQAAHLFSLYGLAGVGLR